MNINTQFLHEVVQNFSKSLLDDGNLCELLDLNVQDIDNYPNPKYQKLYALKYFPAYYFEYAVLANELYERLNSYNIKSVKILSLGCGLMPDYYALLHNMKDIDFYYHGVDACNWPINILPSFANNCHYKRDSVKSLNSNYLADFDVFIFPKSIGDINENALNNLGLEIAKTPKRKIYFLNSFVVDNNRTQNEYHIDLFKKNIHDEIIKAGFSTNDDHNNTCGYGDLNQGLKGINNDFDYHEDGFKLCDENCKDENGKLCKVIQPPILRNSYMNYQILEYTKKNDY